MLEQLAHGDGTIAAEVGEVAADRRIKRHPAAGDLLHDERCGDLLRHRRPEPTLADAVRLVRRPVRHAECGGPFRAGGVGHDELARQARRLHDRSGTVERRIE
jgi:hypothetical protein